jgi:hypothetical protein
MRAEYAHVQSPAYLPAASFVLPDYFPPIGLPDGFPTHYDQLNATLNS